MHMHGSCIHPDYCTVPIFALDTPTASVAHTHTGTVIMRSAPTLAHAT